MANIEGQESVMETRRPIIEVKNLRKEYPVLDETVVALERINPVSYTHLDVYKRQSSHRPKPTSKPVSR